MTASLIVAPDIIGLTRRAILLLVHAINLLTTVICMVITNKFSGDKASDTTQDRSLRPD